MADARVGPVSQCGRSGRRWGEPPGRWQGRHARNAAKADGSMLAAARRPAGLRWLPVERSWRSASMSSKAAGKIWSWAWGKLLLGTSSLLAAAGGIKMLLGGIYSIVAAAKGAVAVTAMAASFPLLGLKAVIAGGAIAALVYGIAKLTGTDKALMDGPGKGLEFIRTRLSPRPTRSSGRWARCLITSKARWNEPPSSATSRSRPEFDRDRKLLQYLEDLSKRAR